jgi:hypothetical protein
MQLQVSQNLPFKKWGKSEISADISQLWKRKDEKN